MMNALNTIKDFWHNLSFSFIWPSLLWLLLCVPVVVLLYVFMQTRRKKFAARYANLVTIGLGTEGTEGKRWHQHIPALLLLLSLSALIVAIARPQMKVMLPSRLENIILAMDSSGSMRADDIKPDRITAAQEAAKVFIADQPRHARIGIVSIAGTAAVVKSPTDNREDITQAIERLQLQPGTALGNGLIISLMTLLPDAAKELNKYLAGGPGGQGRDQAGGQGQGQGGSGAVSRGSGSNTDILGGRFDPFAASAILPTAPNANNQANTPPEEKKSKPVPPGSNTTAAIVLLSDGSSNTGFDVMKAAEIAAEHGMRVYTVGIGTAEGAKITAEGWSARVRLDEGMLKNIANKTHAEYYRAENTANLKKIYQDLSARLTLEKQQLTEVTALFVAFGAALSMLAAMLSMLWFNRIL